MTDPYRTPAEIAADIPRRPLDYAFWRVLVAGIQCGVVLMYFGGRIVEGCATHVPPMRDVPRTPITSVETTAPRHQLAAFPPSIRLAPDPTELFTVIPSDRVYMNYPGEVLTFTCDGDGKPGKASCEGSATMTHKAKSPSKP